MTQCREFWAVVVSDIEVAGQVKSWRLITLGLLNWTILYWFHCGIAIYNMFLSPPDSVGINMRHKMYEFLVHGEFMTRLGRFIYGYHSVKYCSIWILLFCCSTSLQHFSSPWSVYLIFRFFSLQFGWCDGGGYLNPDLQFQKNPIGVTCDYYCGRSD